MVMAVKLYNESLMRFDTGSPYLYPLYGCPAGVRAPERVYGGTKMFAKTDCGGDDEPKAIGVTSEGDGAVEVRDRRPVVLREDRARRSGARGVHPLAPDPGCRESHRADHQAQKQTKEDGHVRSRSPAHNAPTAFVSTTVETANPHPRRPDSGLGHIDEVISVSDGWCP